MDGPKGEQEEMEVCVGSQWRSCGMGGNVSLRGSQCLCEFWGLLREAKEERVAIVDIRICYLHLNIPSFYQVALSINDFM